MLRVGILTISDKGYRGERQDKSGEVIRQMLATLPTQVVRYDIVPDEVDLIADKLAQWAEEGSMDVIVSTGGTGLGPRDVTPEATLSILDRTIPGIAEAIRLETFHRTPSAVLSRAVAGVRARCLIINLPGSPKAVHECLEVVLPVIPHAVDIITGAVTEHGIPEGEHGHGD